MKTLFKTALIIAAITSAIHAQEGQLRLAPSEINALATVNAGAGTSGVSGIQTRTLKGDATKPGIYTISHRYSATWGVSWAAAQRGLRRHVRLTRVREKRERGLGGMNG